MDNKEISILADALARAELTGLQVCDIAVTLKDADPSFNEKEFVDLCKKFQDIYSPCKTPAYNINDKKTKELKLAFQAGVDGANANLFLRIRLAMRGANLHTIPNASKTITFGDLYFILMGVENKQEKAIEKYLD